MTEQITPSPEIVTPVTPTTTPAESTTVVTATPTPPVQTWPDGWRSLLAGDDQKALGQLDRFADPKAVWHSYKELQTRLSSGQVKQALPDNPSPEQLAAYRKENGIPDAPEGYELTLDNGLTIGERDKPIVDHILAAAYEGNVPVAAVNKLVNAYYQAQEQLAADAAEEQAVIQQESQETLRAQWGGEYITNMQVLKNMLSGLPDSIGDELLTAKLNDGSLLGNNAKAISALVNLARELNPIPTMVPGAIGNQVQSIDTEIKTIEETMKKDYHGYQRNVDMKKRYYDLLGARDKLRARGH